MVGSELGVEVVGSELSLWLGGIGGPIFGTFSSFGVKLIALTDRVENPVAVLHSLFQSKLTFLSPCPLFDVGAIHLLYGVVPLQYSFAKKIQKIND